MVGYIKLHRKIKEWEWYDDANTFRLFIHCLIEANHKDKEWRGIEIKRGQFHTSIGSLSTQLKLSDKAIRLALDKLIKTKEVASKGASSGASRGTMITICNYDSYQGFDEAEGQTKGKSKGKQRAITNNDNNDNNDLIIEQYKDIGDEIIIPKKTWKNDFEIYKENVRNGYREIMEDEAWLKKQREFYPNVDILKSIEKSCVNFWITEGGWKNKKKAKTETINWKNTFANAISQPQNKVYYDRNKDLSTTGNTKSGNYSARNDAEERRRSVDNLADLARAILQEP